jgi:pantoate kinase
LTLTEKDFEWWLGCDKSDQYTLHVTETGKQQILENQEDVQRVKDMMAELDIEPPLELWLAHSKEWKEKAELETQLVRILINHCGEEGDNEGAVETLQRIIKKAELYDRLMEKLKNEN